MDHEPTHTIAFDGVFCVGSMVVGRFDVSSVFFSFDVPQWF
jgi:hypothetical protein